MAQVFIAYDRSDLPYVETLAAFLQAAGLTVWYDHQLSAADSWLDAIRAEIDSCAVFVIVMSPAANQSRWVKREFSHADDLDKPVVPLLLSGEPLWFLKGNPYEDVRHGGMPSLRCVERIRSLTGEAALLLGPASAVDADPASAAPREPLRLIPDTPTLAHILTGHSNAVVAVAYSPDGAHVATAGTDCTARIWDPTTGTQKHTLADHGSHVMSVAYSPDGTQLATGGHDKTVRIWDADTAAQEHVLAGHAGAVWSVAYSPDGAHLVTASSDHTVQIWHVPTATHCHTLLGHIGPVFSVAYSPDGTHIASASGDGTVRIWRVARLG